MSDIIYDVAIAGAGPAGLTSALTDKPDMDSPMYFEQVKSTHNIRVLGEARVIAIEGGEAVGDGASAAMSAILYVKKRFRKTGTT